MSEARAVLWDMDGTLIDSQEFHWISWRTAMANEGIAISREQFLSSFGQRNDSILPGWLGAAATPERIERIANAKEELYRQLVRTEGMTPLPGVANWLRRLHEQGWLQAIASAAPRANVEIVLEALSAAHLFQAVVSAEDVQRGKPDPGSLSDRRFPGWRVTRQMHRCGRRSRRRRRGAPRGHAQHWSKSRWH